MRTAEEILKSITNSKWLSENTSFAERIVDAINDARIEVIKECAEKAKSEWVRYGTQMGHKVDIKSILSIADELK
jgi:hypothetical protein